MEAVWYVKDEESGLIDGYYITKYSGEKALENLKTYFPKRKFTLESTVQMTKFHNDFFMKYADWYDQELNYDI
jgi:hypothetical protein